MQICHIGSFVSAAVIGSSSLACSYATISQVS